MIGPLSTSAPSTFSLGRARWKAFTDLAAILAGSVTEQCRDHLKLNAGGRKDQWTALIALAEEYRVASALWPHLVAEQLVTPPPDAIRRFLPADSVILHLEGLALANRQRAAELIGQARALIAALNAKGIEPILLKGISNLFLGIYPDPAIRWMIDIDFLVLQADIPRTQAALEGIGYRPFETEGKALHHSPALYHPNQPGSVEPHFLPLCPRGPQGLSVEMAWRDSVGVDQDGLRFRHLSPNHRVLHNALHAQVSDDCFAKLQLPLRALLDLRYLVAAAKGGLDWSAIAAAAEAGGASSHLETHLLQAQRLFGLPWPLARGPSMATRIRWRLSVIAEHWPVPYGRMIVDTLDAFSRKKLARTGAWQSGELSLLLARLLIPFRFIAKYRGRVWKRLFASDRPEQS